MPRIDVYKRQRQRVHAGAAQRDAALALQPADDGAVQRQIDRVARDGRDGEVERHVGLHEAQIVAECRRVGGERLFQRGHVGGAGDAGGVLGEG